MDGNYQNRKAPLTEILQIWINKVISQKLWDNFVDIHIDEISEEFNEKETWIEGSLSLFKFMLTLIDKSKYEVFLAIPLSYAESPNKLVIKSIDSLKNELGITPPSFYLFPKKYKNFEATIESASYLGELSETINYRVFYREEKEGKEYFRILYLRTLSSD